MKMPDLDLEAIAAGNEVVTYPDGGVVFLRGAVGDCAYIVRQGVVEIREAGRVLERLIPGDVFGEMALIDNEPRSASAVAVGETALVVVDRTTFNRLVRNEPDFALDHHAGHGQASSRHERAAEGRPRRTSGGAALASQRLRRASAAILSRIGERRVSHSAVS